jgi:uncharacterized membrane protein YebE (DUF533 family)
MTDYLSVIRIWAATAWADGVIAEAEAAAMKRLIEAADLDASERETALGWLDAPVELDGIDLEGLSDEARSGIYRAAARLAAVDLDVAESERAFLGRLREALALDEATAREIEKSVPGMS